MAPRAALAVSDLDQAAAAIRARGGRLSWSRRIVLAALFAADGPVSAPDIASGLDGRLTACAVSSVYRNLRDLEALDVVRQVHIADGPALYAVEDGGEQRTSYVSAASACRPSTPSDLIASTPRSAGL